MGSINKNARRTIAASGATDGAISLCSHRSLQSKAVRVPLSNTGRDLGTVSLALPDSQHNGTFDKYEVEHLEPLPDLSPLRTKAQNTQKWQLTRRVVEYRKGQIIWSCNSIAQPEDGRGFKALITKKTSGYHSPQVDRKHCGTDAIYTESLKIARSRSWTGLVSSYSARNLIY